MHGGKVCRSNLPPGRLARRRRDLGVLIDSSPSMRQHVARLAQTVAFDADIEAPS